MTQTMAHPLGGCQKVARGRSAAQTPGEQNEMLSTLAGCHSTSLENIRPSMNGNSSGTPGRGAEFIVATHQGSPLRCDPWLLSCNPNGLRLSSCPGNGSLWPSSDESHLQLHDPNSRAQAGVCYP